MSRVWVVNKRKLYLFTLALLVVLVACIYIFKGDKAEQTAMTTNVADSGERTIHMVTAEFKSTMPDGTVIESYQWHPGTIPVRKGEHINLKIFGVNGEKHQFIIEGLNIKGEVKKGEETTVSFKADKEGIYRIICTDHPNQEHHGPMIGHIFVY